MSGPSRLDQSHQHNGHGSHAATGQGAQPPDNAGPGEDFDLDPLVREGDGDEDHATSIALPKLQMTQAFVDLLRIASLDNSGMDEDMLASLRRPELDVVYELELKNPSPLLRSLHHFINNSGSSRDHYDGLREIEKEHKKEHNPCDVILSFDQVKRRIQHLSGVVPIEHDMCPESCVAYTGPYDKLDSCP